MSRARFGTTPGVPAIGRCFCCFLQQNISQVSVVRLDSLGFRSACVSENSKEPGCSGLFSREPGRQRIANAWRPEITNLTAKLQT
jgi:hypothetical protein